MTLIYGRDDDVAAWVAERIPHVGAGVGFGPCRAIAVARDGVMAAGVVFHDWQPRSGTMQISCAAASPRWASRQVIKTLLAYPFDKAGAQKIWVAIPHDNERAIRFNKGIGMKQEAVLRHHFGAKRHAVILSMLKREYEVQYG
jgi:RimJ/RimL family protein N-acetyltransferase